MSNATNPRRHLNAPRAAYRALLDARAIAQWKVPDGMSCHLHEFEAREGGRFRVSLTYQTASGAGKTSSRTDTYHGRFVELVPDEKVVEVVEFETNDPTLHGEMRIATTLKDVSGGPRLCAAHEGLPRGLSPTDNETGWRRSLGKLAAPVEADERASGASAG